MINKGADVLMDKLCRTCMSEKEDMKDVFESSETIKGHTLKIAEILMACASVQVENGDGLPIYVCLPCKDKLSFAFEFKLQCENTDHALRELKNTHASNSSVKDEESMDIVVQPDLEIYENNDQYYDDSDSDDDKPLLIRSDLNSFTCTYCQKQLRTKKGLKIHQRKHTGEKLHTCQTCQSTFTKRNHLIRHMKLHNKDDNVQSVCKTCDKTFCSVYLSEKHKREHTENLQIESNGQEPGKPESTPENSNGMEEGSEEVKESCMPLKGAFECNFCQKTLNTALGLKTHMRRHTGNNLAKCQLCDKTFTKPSHLKRHLHLHGIISTTDASKTDSVEKERKVIECEFCDRKFVYKKSYTHHMHTEHGMSDDSDDLPLSTYINKPEGKRRDVVETVVEVIENSETKQQSAFDQNEDYEEIPNEIELVLKKNNKTHVCHVCGSSFARANHLTRHMILHRAVLTFKCDRCDKAFAEAVFLEKHIKEDHINKPYVCTVCDKHFGRGEHLIRHLKLHDKKGENLKCSICEKNFTRSDHLARHTKMHLQQDKRHVCTDCGRAFNRLDNLKAHQRVHTGIKDNTRLHLCVYCGKEFNNSSNMIVHMRRHTGERPYKCNECGKGFPRSHDLKCHERTHSGEKPYLCTLCGKSFNKSNKLLRHTRVHTGERPYVCNLCGRAFTQSNDLALHMRRHTGSRPYACGMCPARFIQSGQLKAHRLSTGHWMEVPPELKGGHRVEPVTPLTNPAPIKFKSHGKSKKANGEEQKILNQTVSIMGNISLHTPAGKTMQPFLLEGPKFEFCSTEYTNSVEENKESANDSVLSDNETNMELQKSKDNSPSAFQNNANCASFNVETSSSNTFSQSNNYNFQSYS